MAVQKMQLVNILGQMDNFDEMAEKLYEKSSFHPETSKEFLNKFDDITQFNEKGHSESGLNKALETLSNTGITAEYVNFDDNNLSEEEIISYFEIVNSYVLNYQTNKASYNSTILKYENIIGQLTPLIELDTTIEDLNSFTYVAFRFGKLPIDSYEKFKLFIAENEDVYFFPFLTTKDSVFGMYLAPRNSMQNAENMFKSLNFESMELPHDVNGTPKEVIEHLKEEISKLKLEVEKLDKEYTEYIGNNREKILSCYCKVRKKSEFFNLKKNVAHSDKSFYLLGWVPQEETESLVKTFDNDNDIICMPVNDKSEEIECDKMPPTKLKNFVLFRPFEELLKMYALPSYNEFDPTPLMAFTYSLFFGMMFGDVGQGAILIIAGLIMGHKLKIQLGKVLYSIGIFSVIFGFIYGSFFGYEDIIPFGFKAMHSGASINFTLIVAILIGVVCNVMVIMINIINGIRQKDKGKIFFDVNGIAGLVFYIAVIAGVLLLFGNGTSVFTPLYIAIFVVLPLLLMFLRHPLWKTCNTHRKDWMPKNISEYIVENFL